jgi:hypothetical protein
VFYLDDSWTALASDQYDARGQLTARASFPSYSYDVQARSETPAIYDFSSGVYNTSLRFIQRFKYMNTEGKLLVSEALAGAVCADGIPSVSQPGARRNRVAPDQAISTIES